jgi:hypothetical protein
MSDITFKHIYPNYEEVTLEGYPDIVFYQVKMIVGGRDEDGEFEMVLDGPAQGEKVYLKDSYR